MLRSSPVSEREPRAELDTTRAVGVAVQPADRVRIGQRAGVVVEGRVRVDPGPLVRVERVVQLDAELSRREPPIGTCLNAEMSQFMYPGPRYSSFRAVPRRNGSVGGAMHSVLNCRSKVRSPRGRLGSHVITTRLPPPLIAPVPLSTPVGTLVCHR